MITNIISFLQTIFYLINEDQYNDLKRMFGWAQTNFLLFFIVFLVGFLLLLGPCFKLAKFFCWITCLIISTYLMYLVW